MLTCKQTAELLSKQQDGPIPLRVRVGLRFHLVMCKLCRVYHKQLRWISSFASQLGDVNTLDAVPSEPLSPECKERIKRSLADAE